MHCRYRGAYSPAVFLLHDNDSGGKRVQMVVVAKCSFRGHDGLRRLVRCDFQDKFTVRNFAVPGVDGVGVGSNLQSPAAVVDPSDSGAGGDFYARGAERARGSVRNGGILGPHSAVGRDFRSTRGENYITRCEENKNNPGNNIFFHYWRINDFFIIKDFIFPANYFRAVRRLEQDRRE